MFIVSIVSRVRKGKIILVFIEYVMLIIIKMCEVSYFIDFLRVDGVFVVVMKILFCMKMFCFFFVFGLVLAFF